MVCKIASLCTLELNAWYLDDDTIVGDTIEVYKALKLIQEEGGRRGLHLNICKTEVFWPSPDPRSYDVGVFPLNIGRANKGVKVLGGPVSLDADYCSDLILSKVNKTIHLMDYVRKLKDPQWE